MADGKGKGKAPPPPKAKGAQKGKAQSEDVAPVDHVGLEEESLPCL